MSDQDEIASLRMHLIARNNNFFFMINIQQNPSLLHHNRFISPINQEIMQQKIKLVSFERDTLDREYDPHATLKTEISIAFITYGTGKHLSFVEKFIKEAQTKRNDIGYSKCNTVSAFSYALQKCPAGIPVFCIVSNNLDGELIKSLKNNREIVQNRTWFSVAIFTDDMEKLPKENFHIEGLDLMTSDQSLVLQYIHKALNVRKGLTHQESNSSLGETDFMDAAYRFQAKEQDKVYIHKANEIPDQNQSVYTENTPGFQYNIERKEKITGFRFRGKNISGPQSWVNTEESYARMQKQQQRKQKND